jgi:hypothetical protein
MQREWFRATLGDQVDNFMDYTNLHDYPRKRKGVQEFKGKRYIWIFAWALFSVDITLFCPLQSWDLAEKEHFWYKLEQLNSTVHKISAEN